jgi:hypothetical protein
LVSVAAGSAQALVAGKPLLSPQSRVAADQSHLYSVPAGLDGAAGGAFGSLAMHGSHLYAAVGAQVSAYQNGGAEVSVRATTGLLDGLVRDIALAPASETSPEGALVLIATDAGFYRARDRGDRLESGVRISVAGGATAVDHGFGLAYVAPAPPATGVVVLDISGAGIVPAGNYLPGVPVVDLAVSGNALFVTTGTSVVVASLARPDAPVQIGAFENWPGTGPIVADPGRGLVYVAADDGVTVIDASVPRIRGALSMERPSALDADGARVWVGTALGRTVIADVADPDAPAPAGEIATGDVRALALTATGAFIAEPYRLDVYADASAPPQIAAWSFQPRDVAVGRSNGLLQRLYAVDEWGLTVLEVPDTLGAPPHVYYRAALPGAERLDTRGRFIAVLTPSELWTILEMDGQLVDFVGSAPVEGEDVVLAGPVDAPHAVVAVDSAIEMYRVFADRAPEWVSGLGGWEVDGLAVASDGEHVFVGHPSGVRVISLADPVAPRQVGFVTVVAASPDVIMAVDGSKLHVSERADGLSARLEPRPPMEPAGGPNPAQRAPPTARMITLDVSDPTRPERVAQTDPFGWASGAAAGRGDLVVASGLPDSRFAKRLWLFGVEVASLPMPAMPRAVSMAHPQVFVAAGEAGLVAAHVAHDDGPATATPISTSTPQTTRTPGTPAGPTAAIYLPTAGS